MNELLNHGFTSNAIKSDQEEINEIACHYYQEKGKLVRPTLNLLNIHVSSLVHDDIIDNAYTRRGQQTTHVKYGYRQAAFSGDYIIGRSGQQIIKFNDLRMYQIYSSIMENLVNGEMQQAGIKKKKKNFQNQMDQILKNYLLKTYYKTASLMAYSAQGVGILFNQEQQNQEQLFKFAQHLGISFQLADDMLDFTSDSVSLGKAALADLKEGNVTGPILFAIQEIKNTDEGKKVIDLIQKNPQKMSQEQIEH
ncbi:polyprenyl synthetase, putative, partial [Ichthyophthirius multifiliis]